MNSVNFSVIIPVYNSSSSVIELTKRLHNVFRNSLRESYEIIFVDDCSPLPETFNTLTLLAEESKTIRVFRLSKNFGQASAILCGMSKAKGEWIFTMDDDLQHRPEDIPLLLPKKNHDVVIASFPEKKCGYIKKISSWLKGWLDVHLLGKPRHINASPFRLLKRRVVLDMLSIRTPRPFLIAQILDVTSDLVNVDVEHQHRKFGKSNYSLRKSLSLFSNMFFNNSSFMLRTMSMLGFCLSGISVIYGTFLVFRRISQDQVVEGWTSLMVVLLISTGAIIFCLGVLGEYVARLIATAESRPTWVIRDSIDNEDNK